MIWKENCQLWLSSHISSDFRICVVWKSMRTLRTFFSFKDKLPMHLRSKILYRFTCDGCNSIYIGKTKRHFLVRAYEHLGLSYKTGKRFAYNPDNSNNTTVLNHINQSNQCKGNLDSFEIIGSARNDFFLRIKESLLIKKIKPCLLNPNSQSVPLHLFDWVLRIWVSLFIVIVILLWCLWLCFLITHYLIVNVYFLANGCVIIKLNNAGSVPCETSKCVFSR